MRKLVLLVAGLAVFLIVWPATAVAAAPERTMFTDTFADEICGFTGTTTLTVVDLFTLNSDNTFSDRASVRGTFTSDTGKTLMLSSAGLTTGIAEPITNPDGTITFVNTFIGLPEKVQIGGGPVLSLDAGVVTITRTFTIDENGDIVDLVSQELSGLHGPHPDLLSDFELFCGEITPYLLDP